MNRRAFIQQSSFAAIAISGLPLAVRANSKSTRQQTGTSYYKTNDNTEAGAVLYGLRIDHYGMDHFDSATATQKEITLGIKQYDGTSRTAPTKSAEYKYVIEEAKSTSETDTVWEVAARMTEKISGDYDLPKAISKKIIFTCKPLKTITLKGKKDAVVSELVYVTPSSSGSSDGCFLTTACVEHKGMADNCEPLETLRGLRENFMRDTIVGDALIRDYRVVGPAIVAGINDCANRHEIYEYMYERMIVPCVNMVKSGANAEAVVYYKSFVEALQERYC